MSNLLPPGCVVGVVGAGAMGAGIAQIAAQAGHPVRLLDLQPGAAARAVTGIRDTLAKLAAKGKLSTNAAADAGERLTAVASSADLVGSAIVIEAVVERVEAKRALFAELEPIVGDDAVLATNTSSISVTLIAAGLVRPQRVVGMHFFNPVPLMALVEVVSGLASDPAAAAAVFDLAQRWGKQAVHTKSTPGFIVNRVARPFYAEALRLLAEQAADSATIDAVMREAGGFRMGPFELMDLIGHDVNFAVTRSVFDAFYGDPRFAPSLIQQELVNAGRLGRKSGQGFYSYAVGATVPPVRHEPTQQLTQPVSVWLGSPVGRALGDRLAAAEVPFTGHQAAHADKRVLRVGDALVFVTDGRSATQRAVDLQHPNTLLIDLALDFTSARRLAVAAADTCGDVAFAAAVAPLQAAGFTVSRLADVPGLAVMRTVAMLANEAADAVYQGVCDATAADTAMCKGVNYPCGPLAWADAVGPCTLLTVLDHLAQVYGEDRYRACALLRRLVAGGRTFHPQPRHQPPTGRGDDHAPPVPRTV